MKKENTNSHIQVWTRVIHSISYEESRYAKHATFLHKYY